MMIARWNIDARFGHKQTVIDMLVKWNAEIGTQVGWSPDKVRVLSGAIGALEATVQSEVTIESLAELEESFNKLGTLDAHRAWSKELEPYVVSGSTHWQIFRIV